MSWLKQRNETVRRAKNEGVLNADSRCNGSTLATAMSIVSNAMLNIDKPIRIEADMPMLTQYNTCLRYIETIIKGLNLEGFYINKKLKVLVYSLREDFTGFEPVTIG